MGDVSFLRLPHKKHYYLSLTEWIKIMHEEFCIVIGPTFNAENMRYCFLQFYDVLFCFLKYQGLWRRNEGKTGKKKNMKRYVDIQNVY